MHKHKSGVQKRIEKLEKNAEEVKNRLSTTICLNSTSETNGLVNNDSSIPHTDHVEILETDETNTVSTSSTDSNLCESVPKKLISSTLETSLDLKNPGM